MNKNTNEQIKKILIPGQITDVIFPIAEKYLISRLDSFKLPQLYLHLKSIIVESVKLRITIDGISYGPGLHHFMSETTEAFQEEPL